MKAFSASRHWLVLVAAVALVFLTGMTTHAVEPATVVIFGDSITAGGGLQKDERSHLWVTQVEAQSAGRLHLINEGKGGRPTAAMKEFEEMLVRQPKAEALVLALGMNDSRDITQTCAPKAVNNLRAMVAKARATWGAELPVLIVGPSNIRKDALGPTHNIADQRDAKLKELGGSFEKLAAEMHASYCSLYGVVPEASLKRDGVHPDGAGNDAITAFMLPRLLVLSHIH